MKALTRAYRALRGAFSRDRRETEALCLAGEERS